MTYGIASVETEEILRAAGLGKALEGFGAAERTIEIDVIFQGALDEVFRVFEPMADAVFDALVANFSLNYPGLSWVISIYDRTNDDNPECLREIDHGGGLS